MHFLLIDANLGLAAQLDEFFRSHGHVLDHARDGIKGLQLVGHARYDAVLLEFDLSGVDGLTLCRRLRTGAQSTVPIIIITAKDTERDTLSGFDAGADDYVTKPFSLLELLARLRALVRRTSRSEELLKVGSLTFDPHSLIFRRGQRVLCLAPTGMLILEQLMRASPGVVKREQIERTVWGDEAPGSDASLRGHILIVRYAVDTEDEPKLLHTVHGIGYRLA